MCLCLLKVAIWNWALMLMLLYKYIAWFVNTITGSANLNLKKQTKNIKDWTRLVIVKDQYSHSVYPNIMHKITSLWKFGLNWLLKLKENDERKPPLLYVPNSVLSDGNKRLLARIVFIFCVRSYLFLKNYVTLEGVVSHNVLYYQQLSLARYQVMFYANIYFESHQTCTEPLKQYVILWDNYERKNTLVTRSCVPSDAWFRDLKC